MVRHLPLHRYNQGLVSVVFVMNLGSECVWMHEKLHKPKIKNKKEMFLQFIWTVNIIAFGCT